MTTYTFKQILQDLPPGEYFNVPNVVYATHKSWMSDKEIVAINKPYLHLYCDCEECEGVRLFEYNQFPMHHDIREVEGGDTTFDHVYLEYLCQNCKSNVKSYAIIIREIHIDKTTADIIKVGEFPFFGPNLNPKLISLIGPDRELFLKGAKCESQGLGIGAFTYYRRVVENQRDRIIDNIIKVLQKIGTDAHTIKNLQSAKKQRQFTSSIEDIKEHLPESILIEGQNPLSLLYKALSIGVHELTDDECLEYAHSIRIVLSELSKKLATLSKDNNEIKNAIKNLNKLK